MENDDDFLDGIEELSEPEPIKVEVVEPPVEKPVEQPVVETPEPLELTELAPEQTKPTEGFVPLGAVLDERDKRKAAEARIAQLEQQAAQRQPVQRPDAYDDPDGALAYERAEVSAALQNMTLNTSERFARKEHGVETVDLAKAWVLQRFAADPLYQTQILNDPDPYERVVADWRKDQLFAQVSDPKEFEQFQAWRQAQNTLQQGGQPPPTNQTASIPPRSLASAPSAGTMLTDPIQSDEEMFDEVIPKR